MLDILFYCHLWHFKREYKLRHRWCGYVPSVLGWTYWKLKMLLSLMWLASYQEQSFSSLTHSLTQGCTTFFAFTNSLFLSLFILSITFDISFIFLFTYNHITLSYLPVIFSLFSSSSALLLLTHFVVIYTFLWKINNCKCSCERVQRACWS